MKSFVSSLSLVVVSSWVLGCGGGGDAVPDAGGGDVDAAVDDAAVDDATVNDAAQMGPAPTLTYPASAYTFLSPGNAIPPIVATATADGTKTFAVEGDLPSGLGLDPETGTISGDIGVDSIWDDPPVGAFEVVVTLTDGADRVVAWPIVFTLVDTAETSHTVQINVSCAYCAIPTPSVLTGVHVGDFVIFEKALGGSDEASIFVDGGIHLDLGYADFSVRLGINSGAGTTIGFTSSGGGPNDWPGAIQVVD